MNLVLASASPRREELLRALLNEMGLADQKFKIIPAQIDETRKPGEDPVRYARRLAKYKTSAVAKTEPHSLIVAADTIVVLGDKIFGKPKNKKEATDMLTRLSGKTHQVITAIALLRAAGSRPIVDHSLTKVTLAPLTANQIQTYIATGEPLDKAGAYGIQGGAAGFVAKIEGSYTNVVGLPVEILKKQLQKWLP